MISFTLNFAALLLGASAITLQANDGQSHIGSLEKLDQHQAVIRTDDGLQDIPADQLLRITNTELDSSGAEPTITVMLTDGTQIGATAFEMGKKAKIKVVGGVVLEVDPRHLRTVRFQKPGFAGPLEKDWVALLAGVKQGDLLIVRRGGKALSFLEGTVQAVNKDSVDFVFDNDDFQVSREKIEGLSFLTRKVEKVRADQVVYALGSCLFQAKSAQWTDGGFEVELVCGDKLQLPMSMVRVVDFSASRVVYLSTLEPYKLTVTPRLPTSTLSELARRLIYKPGINRSLSGRRLSLPSGNRATPRQYFDHGLAIHSRTELIYRLEDGEYGRLLGMAGLDPDLKQQGSVRLLIEGDDQPLLEELLGPGDPPLPIDVSVARVRRLRILVDYGDKLDAADHLNLCEIRLTP